MYLCLHMGERKEGDRESNSNTDKENNKRTHNWELQQNKHSAIAFIFTDLLFALLPKDWYGEEEAITNICRILGLDSMNNKNLVEYVPQQVHANYCPIRKLLSININIFISSGSREKQIIADRIEAGCSISATVEFVNLYHCSINQFPLEEIVCGRLQNT